MIAMIVNEIIGLCIGASIYFFGKRAEYDIKLDILAQYDLGWVLLSVWLLKIGWGATNLWQAHARHLAKVPPPNQHAYVTVSPDLQRKSIVLMEDEGVLGQWNRAQRATMNYLEYGLWTLGCAIVGGFVFPFPVFVLSALFVVARLACAAGYTESAQGRMKGYILSVLPVAGLEGIVLLTAIMVLCLSSS